VTCASPDLSAAAAGAVLGAFDGSTGSVLTVALGAEAASPSASSLKSELELGRAGGTAAAPAAAAGAEVLVLELAAPAVAAC